MIYHASRSMHILDLFAGSGAIGVAVLMHVPSARVDFGEKESRHFPTIEKNIRENGVDPARTRIIETDVFSGITGRYDAILANPPYLSKSRLERIQDSVLKHEPAEALFADDDGFALIEETVGGLPEHLVEGGTAWIEHEPEHVLRLAGLAKRHGFTVESLPDQYGTIRFSRLSRVA